MTTLELALLALDYLDTRDRGTPHVQPYHDRACDLERRLRLALEEVLTEAEPEKSAGILWHGTDGVVEGGDDAG